MRRKTSCLLRHLTLGLELFANLCIEAGAATIRRCVSLSLWQHQFVVIDASSGRRHCCLRFWCMREVFALVYLGCTDHPRLSDPDSFFARRSLPGRKWAVKKEMCAGVLKFAFSFNRQKGTSSDEMNCGSCRKYRHLCIIGDSVRLNFPFWELCMIHPTQIDSNSLFFFFSGPLLGPLLFTLMWASAFHRNCCPLRNCHLFSTRQTTPK